MRLPTTTALLAGALGALALGPAPAALGVGERDPKIKILGPQGRLDFEVRPRDACASFADVPVRLRFRGHGTTRTYDLDEPCGEWEADGRAAPNVRFTPEDGTRARAGRLRLRATGKEEVERRYRYVVQIDGEETDRGIMRVVVRKADGGGWERFVFVDD